MQMVPWNGKQARKEANIKQHACEERVESDDEPEKMRDSRYPMYVTLRRIRPLSDVVVAVVRLEQDIPNQTNAASFSPINIDGDFTVHQSILQHPTHPHDSAWNTAHAIRVVFLQQGSYHPKAKATATSRSKGQDDDDDDDGLSISHRSDQMSL